jgi:manganese transport protein
LNPLIILVYSQVALSLLLPLPLVPLWWFTRKKELMGVFSNRKITTIVAGIFILLIIGLNVMLLYFTFTGAAQNI